MSEQTETSPGDPWLSPDEVARLLDVHTTTLRRWRQAGSGPAYSRIGSRYRYRRSDVDAYLEGARSGSQA